MKLILVMTLISISLSTLLKYELISGEVIDKLLTNLPLEDLKNIAVLVEAKHEERLNTSINELKIIRPEVSIFELIDKIKRQIHKYNLLTFSELEFFVVSYFLDFM